MTVKLKRKDVEMALHNLFLNYLIETEPLDRKTVHKLIYIKNGIVSGQISALDITRAIEDAIEEFEEYDEE